MYEKLQSNLNPTLKRQSDNTHELRSAEWKSLVFLVNEAALESRVSLLGGSKATGQN